MVDVAEGGTSAADLSDETIVAGTEKGLYISRDSGDTWRAVGAGLPQAELQDLAIEGSTFLASMRAGGLYLSRDRGENWTRVTGTSGGRIFSGGDHRRASHHAVCGVGDRRALCCADRSRGAPRHR